MFWESFVVRDRIDFKLISAFTNLIQCFGQPRLGRVSEKTLK